MSVPLRTDSTELAQPREITKPPRGRPKLLTPADVAEATSLAHADLRQARRHLAAAFRLLQGSEARLVPVIRSADTRAGAS